MAQGPRPLSRRTALRAGGGLVALAVGVGAGVVDRRSSDGRRAGGAGLAERSQSTTATSSTSTTTVPTTTTTLPSVDTTAVTEGILAVGSAYLRLVPDEADLGSLLAALPAPGGDVVEAARRGIRADFLAGDTVQLDGWVLARSEARAAAVLALTCDAPTEC